MYVKNIMKKIKNFDDKNMIICGENRWNGISYKKQIKCNNFQINFDVENHIFWP